MFERLKLSSIVYMFDTCAAGNHRVVFSQIAKSIAASIINIRKKHREGTDTNVIYVISPPSWYWSSTVAGSVS